MRTAEYTSELHWYKVVLTKGESLVCAIRNKIVLPKPGGEAT